MQNTINNMDVFPYRKLFVYQHSMTLAHIVNELIKTFPSSERFALSDQLHRASISICSNIAEGVSRYSGNEEGYFISMAFGSLNEVMCQIELAYDYKYISEDQLKLVENEYLSISKMLSGLRKSFMQKK